MAANPSIIVACNYGASGTLQQQIEQGAPVDVYLSASPKQMDALEKKGLLLPGTRKNLLRNEIVLIVPKDSSSHVSSFQDLARPDVKQIALGEPTTVPAGEYAQEVLTYLGIYGVVKPKAVLAKDVRQVLTYVETGNVDAGIVYSTDAALILAGQGGRHGSRKIACAGDLSRRRDQNSKKSRAARAFEDFLFGAQARAIFQKYGFIPASS